MLLPYADLQFTAVPERRFPWPRLARGPILRGALGTILREVVCDPMCADSDHCRYGVECAYQTLFAPRAPVDATRLSLNLDRPRPFVVVPGDEPEEVIPKGEPFTFTVRLFGLVIPLYPYIVVVFLETARRGLGPERIPIRITSTTSGGEPVHLSEPWGIPVQTLSLDLQQPTLEPPSSLCIHFRTPIYLKDGGREIRTGAAALGALARRTRDRLSALYHFYAATDERQPLDWDFRQLGDEAEEAQCLRDDTWWIAHRRRSTRTGQLHDLSGLVGSAVYGNVPARSRRLLELGAITHAGKHAAFGLGRFETLPWP